MDPKAPAHKFTTVAEGGAFLRHQYDDQFMRDGSRLVIAPESGQVDLLLSLARELPPPLYVLYVLQVEAAGFRPGRYELEQTFTADDLQRFLARFGEFFENDGRHHVWVGSTEIDATIVYDQHNVLYAYGPLDAFEEVCLESGLEPGIVEIPFPHAHAFDEAFDSDLTDLLSEWTWTRSELIDDVDDP